MEKKLKLETGTVYSVRMMSGEEFVARLDDMDDDNYYFHSPLGFGMGKGGLQMMPLMVSTTEKPDAMIPRTAVMMVASCRPDVEEVYRESISDIVRPSKQIITG